MAKYYRRSIRLRGHDYSGNGWYFVTICTHNRENLLGDIVGATRGSPPHMELNANGSIVDSIWKSLPNHHPVILDAFQIMPNHIHFIVKLMGGLSGGLLKGESRLAPTTVMTMLGMVVGFLKSESTKQIKRVWSTRGLHTIKTIWQRNYYEHVIRDKNEYQAIDRYIQGNVINWNKDELNLT